MNDVVYTDKSTGEEVRIVNDDVNFYELDNSVRIKKEVFAKKYEKSDFVDPNAFFQTQYASTDPLLNMAQQLKNMDTSKINDNPTNGAQVKYTAPVVLSDNSMSQSSMTPSQEAPIHLSPEEKAQYLAEWARTQPGAQIPKVQNINWEEEEERFLNGDKPIQSQPRVEIKQVDPIQSMFKMFKNSFSVKLNVEIEEKIPSPAFIGMIQENIETDAVEYYANLISDKILGDPSNFRTQIYDQLKKIINEE